MRFNAQLERRFLGTVEVQKIIKSMHVKDGVTSASNLPFSYSVDPLPLWVFFSHRISDTVVVAPSHLYNSHTSL
jgi:hypothetical protein